MLFIFLAPLNILIFGSIDKIWAVFFLYIISGLGMAGIGMGIMHDAIHGSYSKFSWLNRLMSYSINLIGSNKDIWRIQHNVLHHSFTNIENMDEDLDCPKFLRFSPHSKWLPIHRFQYLYAWLFYGLMTISWITFKDFVNLNKFYASGYIKDRKTYRKVFCNILIWKLIFFILVLFLPLAFSSVSIVVTLSAFFVMNFITGLIISTVFQTAHIMPKAQFPLPNELGAVENERMIHQLITTCNFSENNPFLSWMFGGLTNQIEHHLFPNISHIHYRKLAPIVQQTAHEFGLPYHKYPSFFAAILSHFQMLKELGASKAYNCENGM